MLTQLFHSMLYINVLKFGTSPYLSISVLLFYADELINYVLNSKTLKQTTLSKIFSPKNLLNHKIRLIFNLAKTCRLVNFQLKVS